MGRGMLITRHNVITDKIMGPSTFVEGETQSMKVCFQNLSEAVVDVFWIGYDGSKQQYASLQPSKMLTQSSYSTHIWSLEYQDGSIVRFLGPSAYVQLLAGGEPIVRPLEDLEDDTSWRNPEWGEYKKRGETLGMDVMAYECVPQEAVQIAEHLVGSMLKDSPPALLQRMVDAGCKIAIMGRNQVTSDIPPHHFMKFNDGDRDTDSTTRGLGATKCVPTTSCSEENLTMVEDWHYTQENILIHEFGHAVMNLGFDTADVKLIEQLYQEARDKCLYNQDCYMMDNADEYWAEACQSWFEATIRCDVNSGIKTREELKQHDPGLAKLLTKIFGDGSWRYPQTSPSKFTCKSSSQQAAKQQQIQQWQRQRQEQKLLQPELPPHVQLVELQRPGQPWPLWRRRPILRQYSWQQGSSGQEVAAAVALFQKPVGATGGRGHKRQQGAARRALTGHVGVPEGQEAGARAAGVVEFRGDVAQPLLPLSSKCKRKKPSWAGRLGRKVGTALGRPISCCLP